jgi:hypothetical protein
VYIRLQAAQERADDLRSRLRELDLFIRSVHHRPMEAARSGGHTRPLDPRARPSQTTPRSTRP